MKKNYLSPAIETAPLSLSACIMSGGTTPVEENNQTTNPIVAPGPPIPAPKRVLF